MPRTLNILIQNRPDTPTNPGGDTVQMERTAQFLRELGHRVDISFELSPDLRQYDVIHLFNLTRPFETHAQAINAKRQGKPYVLSSVYWDLEAAVPWSAYEFPRNVWRRVVPSSVRRFARRIRGGGGAASVDEHPLQAEIIRDAVVILPNSHAEKQHLLDRFPGVPADRFVVVLNGIDPPSEADSAHPSPFPETAGAFICAGAIGPRKNQLNLVRAFRELPDQRLVIIGNTSPGSERYLRAARKASTTNITFRPSIDHPMMLAALRDAKALVQPSYIETPGLSAMEAASLGLPVVVANVSPVREYFGDSAHYCDPSSPASITAACRAATTAQSSNSSTFASMYNWSKVLSPLKNVFEYIN